MLDEKVLAEVDALESFQATRSDSWNVPRGEGEILHALALACGARYVVEVGTSYGFSGLFLAAAARAAGGRLHTFERNGEKHDLARAAFERAGLADVVTLHTGDARELLGGLEGGVDFLFLDATKSETFDYWQAVEDKLAPRCVVTLDNTANLAGQMKPFMDYLHGRSDFHVCDIPAYHGLGVAVRVA
jgi:predicted O-methyltransferase YrrM